MTPTAFMPWIEAHPVLVAVLVFAAVAVYRLGGVGPALAKLRGPAPAAPQPAGPIDPAALIPLYHAPRTPMARATTEDLTSEMVRVRGELRDRHAKKQEGADLLAQMLGAADPKPRPAAPPPAAG